MAIRVDAAATQGFSLVAARGISKGQHVHENPRRCHTVQGGRAREGRASGGVELPGPALMSQFGNALGGVGERETTVKCQAYKANSDVII